MVALKLSNFGGMIPAVNDRLLPDNSAALSQNTWVYSGAIEGIPAAVLVHQFVAPDSVKAFRIPVQKFGKDNIPDSYWLEFSTTEIDVIPSPASGDSYERYYWAGLGTEPTYNTKARIIAGNAAYKLGIPAPTVAPTVTPAGGASAILETRAYVYTWVSTFGEEGPPSPPVLVTGKSDATFNVTVSGPGGSATGRTLAKTRIYRTITGSTGSTTYYFVDEVPIATLAYADTITTLIVSGKNILESLYYEPPPIDLEGFIAMPNGITAAWRENEVWFSEPYRPHAWPSIYTLSVDSKVMGLGVIGQSLIVCTRVSPYTISGVDPSAMTVSKIAVYEPCLSRSSIISTEDGVIYASQNGLVLTVPGDARVVTRNLMTKNMWLDSQNFVNSSNLKAAAFNGAYYCWSAYGDGCFEPTAFGNDSFLQKDFTGSFYGAIIDLSDSRLAYTQLTHNDTTDNCYTDIWTGEILLVRDGAVYWLDLDPQRAREPFLWRSKVLEAPNQRNFEAMRVYFEPYENSPFQSSTRNVDPVQELAADQWGVVRLYADGVLRMTRELRKSGELFRLPSGFKATYWQIEIEARVKIFSVEVATTAKELGSV